MNCLNLYGIGPGVKKALFVGVFLVASPTTLQAAQAGGQWVEATGEAQISDAGEVAAKQKAQADAFLKCIEKVVGIMISSEFTSEQQEVVKNNQNDFYANIRDQLSKKSKGFIKTYEVLKEEKSGDIMKVTVKAQVFESKLKAEAMALADLLKAAGNPRLMVVIQEVETSTNGKLKVRGDSVLSVELENLLLEKGFKLISAKKARDMARLSPNKFDAFSNNVEKVSRMARDEGATLVVMGRIEIKNKGPIENTAGLDSLKGQIRLELKTKLRAIETSTNEVISSQANQLVTFGTSEERALHRALRGRGKNLVKQNFDTVFEDFKKHLLQKARQGQQFIVELQGMKSFRKEGRSFMSLLESLPDVSQVAQKSLKKKKLVVSLSCRCTLDSLQEAVLAGVEGLADLKDLDLQEVSGIHLKFAL